MRRTQVQHVIEPGEGLTTTSALVTRVRDVAAVRIDEALAEVPATIRRLRMLLLVISVSIPLFLVAMIAVLWRLAA